MKKTLSLLLAFILLFAVICLSLAACGKDYGSRTFNFFGDSFHWDMTIEETENYIKENQINEADIEIDKHETNTIVSDGYYIFKFDTNGKMEFVKVVVGADEHLLDLMIEEYGDYDKKDEIGDDPFYSWYGTMNGEHTKMVLDCTPLFDIYYIEFTLED